MSYDCDFVPARLFLCRVISTCFDVSPEGKSDMCQMLYARLQEEDRTCLRQKELQFMKKMEEGWEPTKIEALAFFRASSVVNELLEQVMAEWKESVSSTHSLVVWMLGVQQWKEQYSLDSISDNDREIYLFVASMVASFLLLPFSSLDAIVSSLLVFLRDESIDSIGFPPPLPPYIPHFSSSQRMAWAERFQSVLYHSSNQLDLKTVTSQLHRVNPLPKELLASIALLEDNFAEAEALLRDAFSTTSLFSLLYPLTQYALARGYTADAEVFLKDLERAVQKKCNRDELCISSFLRFLLLNDEASLSVCLSAHPTAFQKYALFVVMKRTLLFPRVLTTVQQLLPDHAFVAPACRCTCFEDVLNACDMPSFQDVLMDYVLKERDAIEPFLSASDLQFADHENDFAGRVQRHLDHHRLCEAEAAVSEWRQVCLAQVCPKADKEVEEIRCALYEAVIASRCGWRERALRTIQRCRETCVRQEYDLWTAICDLVLCFVLQEVGSSTQFVLQRLQEAVPVFCRLRQKELLHWSCLLLARGKKEKGGLLKLKSTDAVFMGYLKVYLFECGLVPFSDVIAACKRIESVFLVNQAVEKGSRLLDSATIERWEMVKREEESWSHLDAVLCDCLLSTSDQGKTLP